MTNFTGLNETGISRRATMGLIAGSAAALTMPALAEAAKPLEERGYALGDQVLGAEDAPVTVYEYASLTCPHCASFHQGPFLEMNEKYIETGQVKLVMREVYFDRFGLWGAMVARSGGDARYFPFIKALFQKQRAWARAEDGVADELRKIARVGGVGDKRVNETLQDQEFAQKLVADYQENIDKFKEIDTSGRGVSTPSFIVSGDIVNGGDLFDAIEKAL